MIDFGHPISYDPSLAQEDAMTQTADSNYYKAPRMGASLGDWLARSRRWDIEYGGYLSNHLTHNWLVMSAVGASDADMQWWQDLYTNRLAEKPAREAGDLEPARAWVAGQIAITEANWRDHFETTRIAFPAYRDFFDARIAELGLAATLHAYLPPLLPGLAGAALHPLIHTGWGAEAESPLMVADGLAYMATAHQPLGGDAAPNALWSPDAPGPLAAALAFLTDAKGRGLARVAHDASQTEAYRQLQLGRFQPRLIAFDDSALPLGAALNEIGPIGLPSAAEPLNGAIEELTVLLAAALRGSDNEFFVLHGLTSLHAVLALVPHLEADDQRQALSLWWRAAMATIVAQNFPGLSQTAALLEDWQAKRKRSPRHRLTAERSDWWRTSIKEALASLDEHLPKAVYVLWRWTEWQAFSEATAALFEDAARNLLKPHPSGPLHDNLWTSDPASEFAKP
jgi:hypothetical protein